MDAISIIDQIIEDNGSCLEVGVTAYPCHEYCPLSELCLLKRGDITDEDSLGWAIATRDNSYVVPDELILTVLL